MINETMEKKTLLLFFRLAKKYERYEKAGELLARIEFYWR